MKRLHLKDAKGYSTEYIGWLMGVTVRYATLERQEAWVKAADEYFRKNQVAPCPDVQRAEGEGLAIPAGRNPQNEGMP